MRRVVITGLGAVTPVGNDVPTTWAALVAGQSGISEITCFDADSYPVNIAGEVKGFDPGAAMSAKEVRRTGRDVHLGMAAAMEAVADAGFEVADPRRTGVIIGSCVGGMAYTLEQQKVHDERGHDRVSPHWIPNMLPDTTTSHVATAIGARGVNYALLSACATSTHTIGDAAEVIIRGQADAILAGGTEAVVMPVVLAGFCAMRALVDGRDDPPAASRPFDATRAGFVLSEGAAVVMVEELDHARSRGARIYCEVVGYGVSNDAYHVATPHPESLGVVEMISAALERGGIAPEEVDYVNAHGTSTPYNDVAETRALKAVFGDHARRLAISSTKSMVGHSFGAAGGIEAVATALTHPPWRDPAHHQPPPPRPRLRSRLRAQPGPRGRRAHGALELDGPRRPQRLHHPAPVRGLSSRPAAVGRVAQPHPPPLHLAGADDLVDQPVASGLLGGHEVVALGVVVDLLRAAPRVLRQHLLHPPLQGQDLAGPDLDVGGLALEARRVALVDHDLRVGQRQPLALGCRRPAGSRPSTSPSRSRSSACRA